MRGRFDDVGDDDGVFRDRFFVGFDLRRTAREVVALLFDGERGRLDIGVGGVAVIVVAVEDGVVFRF